MSPRSALLQRPSPQYNHVLVRLYSCQCSHIEVLLAAAAHVLLPHLRKQEFTERLFRTDCPKPVVLSMSRGHVCWVGATNLQGHPDTFDCHHGGAAPGVWWVEAREATEQTPVRWTAPATESPPAQNVSGAKAEKPCLKPNRGPGHFTTWWGEVFSSLKSGHSVLASQAMPNGRACLEGIS